MQNIEIKMRLPDREAMEERLASVGARRVGSRRQRDTYFAVPAGRLKLRETRNQGAELIAYRRSTDTVHPRSSDYDVMPVENAEACKALLGRVLLVDKVVEKQRDLWLYRHTRIHVDRVAGLGEFLELETAVKELTAEQARAENAELIATLALDPHAFLAHSYRDLVG